MRRAVLLLAISWIACTPATADGRPGVPTAANWCKLRAGTIDKPGSTVKAAIWRMGPPTQDWSNPGPDDWWQPQLQWNTRRFEFTAFLTSGRTRLTELGASRLGRWKLPCPDDRGGD